MPLPSRTTAQLFTATVDLVDVTTINKLNHWKNLIDQGGCIDETIAFQNPRFNQQHLTLSALEVMFSCWDWETLAKGIEHIPSISTSDFFFQNIAKNFQEIHMFHPFATLQQPFETWFNQAKRGIEDMPYGQWGPWETLMYRPWQETSVKTICSVMKSLKTLPKIQSTATLQNLYTVATMGTMQNINFGGIMALTVGLSPDLYASAKFQRLSTFIQKTPHLLQRWNTAQDALSLLQQQELMEAIGQSTPSKQKKARKL